MMRHLATLLLIVMISACGPNPDEIVKLEDKKLSDLEPVEVAKVEEAMNRIRQDSEIIARGGVLPARSDSMAKDTVVLAPAPTPALTARPTGASSDRDLFPHQIQLAAFTSAAGAKSEAEAWEKRGFSNVIHLENSNARSEYRFVVRLTGFAGYTTAFAESQRINAQFGVRSYPLEVK